MEYNKENIKCSFKDHLNIDAISYCQNCKIYMCNKCINTHSNLFQDHNLYKVDQDIKNIFTGYCKNENHPNKLEYFCKSHNELCCAACLCKLDEIGDGKHKDCEVCILEDIIGEKKKILENNIRKLETLSKNFEDYIKEIKILQEKINKKKEDIQKKLKSIFTKIINKLNEREDELLLDIENIFNKLYFNDDIIKIIEKLPTRIKSSLEKGKEINEEWTEKQLNYLINICINIENTWTDINTIKWKIEKSNFNMKTKILFKPEKEGINNIINTIKNFGEIYIKNFQKYALRNCELNNDKKIKFEISGKNNNIFTKSCNDQDDDNGTICINELDKSIEEHRWKIKILKTKKKKNICWGSNYRF